MSKMEKYGDTSTQAHEVDAEGSEKNIDSPPPELTFSDDSEDGEREYFPGDPLYLDPVEEAGVVRKMDIFVAPVIMLVYVICALDRSNIGNAAAAGMATAIGLKGDELSVAVSIYFVTYISAEVPVTMLCRRIRPRIIVPGIMCVWAFIMIGSGFMTNYAGLLVTRLLIGFCEAGMFPYLNVYLTSFYKRKELSRRIACLFLSLMLSGAVGGLLASGFLKMDGVGGKPGWQWLYLMEAVVSVVAAILVYFVLPDSPETAYFLKPEEKALVRIRTEQRKQYMGDNKYTKADFKKAFTDPKVYLSGIIQHFIDIPLYGFSTFLPVIISGLGPGYSGIRAQLLTVPVYAASAVAYVIAAWAMDKYETRYKLMIPAALINIVGYAVLLGLEGHNNVKYAMTFLVGIGLYIVDGGSITWLNVNQAPQMKRSIAIAFQQSIGNAGGVVAGQIYRASDRPGYKIGHGTSLAAMAGAMIFTGIKVIYLKRVNAKRALLSKEEKERLVQEGAVGDASPKFVMKY